MKKLPKFGEVNESSSQEPQPVMENIKHPVIAKYGISMWDADNAWTRNTVLSFAVVQAYLDYFNTPDFDKWLTERERKLGITLDRNSGRLEFYGADAPTKIAGITIEKVDGTIPEISFKFEGDIGDEEVDWSDMTPKDVNGFKLGVGYIAYPDSNLMHVSATYF